MRKVRDFDAELKVLGDKQRALKVKRVQQLGELVLATGAEQLSVEQLAGALIDATLANADAKEAWRRRGADFFQGITKARGGSSKRAGKSEAGDLFAQSPPAQTSA